VRKDGIFPDPALLRPPARTWLECVKTQQNLSKRNIIAASYPPGPDRPLLLADLSKARGGPNPDARFFGFFPGGAGPFSTFVTHNASKSGPEGPESPLYNTAFSRIYCSLVAAAGD